MSCIGETKNDEDNKKELSNVYRLNRHLVRISHLALPKKPCNHIFSPPPTHTCKERLTGQSPDVVFFLGLAVVLKAENKVFGPLPR